MSGRDRAAFVARAEAAYGRDVRPVKIAAVGIMGAALAMGDGPPVVLLHGWPMTSRCWRFVLPSLAAGGRRALALDLPGLGGTGPATDGYDTVAMAADVLRILDAVGVGRFALVGHDIGGMVSVSLALSAPERVEAMCLIETQTPGLGQWEETLKNPHLWHFGFHATPGLPETLVAGREREYVGFFRDRDADVREAWSDADLDAYATAYSDPARLRAGFEVYRAFPRSAERNQELARRGPLPMPVFAAAGKSSMGTVGAASIVTVAGDVRQAVYPCGHFVQEEAPEAFTPDLVRFLDERAPIR